jgi:oxygen-independent coproporphyrinogen-3 oxidase
VCDLEAQAEVTLEANPQDITAEGLIELRKLGINRLSVGMQSLHQAELDAVDRRQRVDDAKTALEAVRSAGFESFSLDFMFGLPGQTLRGWIDDLGEIVSFGAPHLSIYALTVEPKTALERRISEGKVRVASDDLSASMLFAARELLTEAGYLHYEVSSYAKPGVRARHNSAYWRMQPYWGLGAGAHGFDGERRWVNTRQHKRYMEATSVQQFEMTSELLSSGTLAFERVITGLRDLENGVDLGDDHHHYREAIELEVKRGRLVSDGRSIRLTDQGLRFMNDVLLSFA